MSGPQRYPGALTGSAWYQDTYPGSKMESNVGVLHTTETTGLPGYEGGATAPNFTAVPDFKNKKLIWYQHFDFDVSSRALRNMAGGVETNTANAVQLELVGTCDLTTHKRWNDARRQHLFWPASPDWAQLELAKFVRWAYDEHGIRMASANPDGSPLVWRAYPGSYGNTTTRFTFSEWRAFYGWCGHQHVPENLHGDPGAFPIARILSFAKNKTWEDDLPYTPKEIATATWMTDGVLPAPVESETNPYWAPVSYLKDIDVRVRRIEQALSDIAALVAAAKS